MLARLPFGLYALAVVLYLAEARDSYAVAGLVDGAFGIGAAIGVPVQSRLIDRFGQRARAAAARARRRAPRPALLIALTEVDAPTIALVGCALVGGFAVPAIGSALRALWPELLRRRDELLSTAFALDCVSIELLFTVGPLLSAAIIALVSPIAALAAERRLRAHRHAPVRHPQAVARLDARRETPARHGLLGALRSPGVVTLALSAAPVGFCFGTVEISMPAFAEQLRRARVGRRAALRLGGGERGRRPRLRRPALDGARCRASTCASPLLLPLGFLPALLAPSVAAMALLIIPAGLLIAPLGAAANQIVGTRRAGRRGDRGLLVADDVPDRGLRGRHGGRRARSPSTSSWEACFVAASLAAAAGARDRARPPGDAERRGRVPAVP